MKEFLLVFRNDPEVMAARTEEEIHATGKKWMDWMGGIAAQNKLVSKGNRLSPDGKVVKPGNVVTDGPYTEIKETIGGYSIIKSDSYEEAVDLAKGCPIYVIGGNVEVREIDEM